MPTERLEAVGWLVGERSMPISRACRALNLGRSCYYRPQRNQAEHDAPVIARLNEVVGKHGRWGFWKCFHWMRLKGETWNHKRVWRVYRTMKLNLPRRAKRRLPARVREPLNAPPQADLQWSMEVREAVHLWMTEYNEECPHKSLGNLPPSLYRQQLKQTKSTPNSNFQMSH